MIKYPMSVIATVTQLINDKTAVMHATIWQLDLDVTNYGGHDYVNENRRCVARAGG